MSGFIFPLKNRKTIQNTTLFNNTTHYSDAHKRLARMMKIFDDICIKLNVNYWACGGTLIGAVRHQKNIPWDCDLDVCMPLSDYLIFKQHIDATLPSDLAFFDHSKMPWVSKGLVKIVDLYSNWVDSEEKYKGHKNAIHHIAGLQLDIFIYRDTIIQNKPAFISTTPWVTDIADGPHLKTDIFPVRRFKFEDIEINVPKNVEKICIKGYGGFPPPFPESIHQHLKYGRIDLNNPSPIFVNYFKDIYSKKITQWFSELSTHNVDIHLNQLQEWSFCAKSWNELMKHIIIDDLNMNEHSTGKLLEIGCGVGAFLKEVETRAKNVEIHGIDINDQAIKRCKEENPSAILSVCDAKLLSQYQTDGFEYLVSISTVSYLQSLDDVSTCVSDVLRILKKDGVASFNLISGSPSNLGTYLTIIPESWWYHQKFNASSVTISKPDNPDFKGRYCVKIVK